MSNENPSVELAPLKGSIVLDLEQFNENIEEVEERISDLKELFNDLIIKIHIAGLDQATEDLLNFSDLLDHIGTENTADIKINGIEEAQEQVERLKAELAGLNGDHIVIPISELTPAGAGAPAPSGEETGIEAGERDIDGFREKITELANEMNEFGMNYAFMFTMPIVAGMEKAIDVTGNLNANIALANKEFGKAGRSVQDFGNNSINALDLSRQETLQLVNMFGLAGNTLGGTKEQTAQLAMKLTELAQNMNLATGGTISLQTAGQALTGMLGGNSYALKTLGLNISSTALNQEALTSQFHKAYKKLTPYQQAVVQTDLVQKDLNKSLGGLKGNLGGMYGQVSKLKAEVLQFAEQMGETLKPQVNMLVKKMGELTKWFDTLSPKQKDFIRDCIELAGILPVIALGIGSVVKTFEMFEGVLGVIDGLLDANPIGIAIMALVAVGAVLYEAWKHDFGGIQAIVENTIDYMKPVIDSLGSFIKSTFKSLEPTFKELGESFQKLAPVFNVVCFTIGDVVKGAFSFMVDEIKLDVEIISEAIKILGPVFSAVFDGIGDGITAFEELFEGKFHVIGSVCHWLNSALNDMANGIAGTINSLGADVGSGLDDIVGVVEGIGGDMEQAGSIIIHSMLDGIEGAWSDVTGWIGNAISNLESTVSNEASHIWSDITGSHATGLDFVPWDGYKAELHKGEMVLTADQAEQFRSGGNAGSGGTTNITVNAPAGNGPAIAGAVRSVLTDIANGF